MPIPLAAAVIGSSVISGLANGAGQRETARTNYYYTQQLQQQQNNFNSHENNIAYQRNLSQWLRENAYNSPEAQMERYKAAGLNPNLIYGQQNTSAASPTASVTSPQHGGISKIADYGSMGIPNNLAMQYQDMQQTQKQMELMQQQIDTQKALEQNYRSLAFLNAMKGDKEYSNKPYWAKNAEYDSLAKSLRNSYLQQQINDVIFHNEQLNPLRAAALDWSNKSSEQTYNFHDKIDPLEVSKRSFEISKISAEIQVLKERAKEIKINNRWSDEEKRQKINAMIEQSDLRGLDKKYKYNLLQLLDRPIWNFEDAMKFIFSLPSGILTNLR